MSVNFLLPDSLIVLGALITACFLNSTSESNSRLANSTNDSDLLFLSKLFGVETEITWRAYLTIAIGFIEIALILAGIYGLAIPFACLVRLWNPYI
jgi:glucose uptake protein GlcU